MFDLKGFRKDRKMSQKQISEILGIGTSFISQIETGKDPMPGYIPDKLIEAYGKAAVDNYFHEDPVVVETERFGFGHRKYMFSPSAYFPTKKGADSGDTTEVAASDELNEGLIERVIFALERRDELAFQQQREYERQGARIDEIVSYLRTRA
jgi:transcriptional regulator with XRE-family HTH domain